MKKYFIYKITNLINNKIYVGKSQHNLLCGSTRWQIHLKVAKGGKEKYPRSFSVIHKAINKYGEENFFYQIIDEFETEKESLYAESKLIYKLKNNGCILYNLTNGGDGMSGFTHTKESCQKISFAQQGEKSSNAKLSEIDVINIKQLLLTTERIVIAEKYNVSISTINMIAQGRRWKHIKLESDNQLE